MSPEHKGLGELCARVFELFSPDELPAVRAVGGLSQVGGHKLVPVDLVHPPPHRPLPLPSEVLKDPVPLQSPCAGGRRREKDSKTLGSSHTVTASGLATASSLGSQPEEGMDLLKRVQVTM